MYLRHLQARVCGLLRVPPAGGRPLLSRLIRGTAWTAVSGVFNQGGTFVTSIAAARLLGQNGFGQYAIVLSTLMSIAAVAQTGLGVASTKYIAEYRSVDKLKTGRILGLCSLAGTVSAVLFSALLAVFAHSVAGEVLGAGSLAASVAIGAVFVMFSAVNSQQVAALTGLERFQAMATPSAVCTLVTIATVSLGSLTHGVEGAIAGLAAAMALRCLYFRRVLIRELRALEIPMSYSGIKQELPALYRFALPSALSGYFLMAGLCFGNALLVNRPDGYKHMAHYSAAMTIRTIVMFAPLLINSVGLAILNNVQRASEARTATSVWRMNVYILTGSTVVLSLLAGLFGRWALHIYGSEFAQAGTLVLSLLLISAVLEATMLSFFQRIQSMARMWRLLFCMTIPWQLAFSAAALLLVPTFSAPGLAAAHLIGMLVALVGSILGVVSLSKGAAVVSPAPEPLRPKAPEPRYSAAQL